MKKTRKPNGKNIEIALELLELYLILKESLKKTMKKANAKRLIELAEKYSLSAKLESLRSGKRKFRWDA